MDSLGSPNGVQLPNNHFHNDPQVFSYSNNKLSPYVAKIDPVSLTL
jgi:hypothetical protein